MANFFKEQIKSEERDIKNIWRRIRKRDFSGNTGLAVKNSIYNTLQTFVAKVGSLIFTIILARLLMPELFGLYSLALSTILIFVSVSQLGINQALIRFISNALGKKKRRKARNYIKHFGKIEFVLTAIAIFLLLILSRFISETYYQKPIFLALLAGIFYILFIRFSSFFSSILNSFNNFRDTLFQEIVFQVSRIILVPLAVVCALKLSLSDEKILFYVILFLSVSYLLSGIYLLFISKKEIFPKLEKAKKQKNLSLEEKKEANRFVFLSAMVVLSGVFFGNIDKIMLGGFVTGEFIGYYQAAFSLIGVLTSLSAFGAVLLPIFSRVEKKVLRKVIKKIIRLVFLISVGVFLVVFIFSHLAILVIFGKEYFLAINIFRLLSILILILPITSIYLTYFMSENKPEVIAKSLGLSTLLNIVLNYILIITLLSYGEITAVYGAVIATVISKVFYLGMLVFNKK